MIAETDQARIDQEVQRRLEAERLRLESQRSAQRPTAAPAPSYW
jgi:hypothetical protein